VSGPAARRQKRRSVIPGFGITLATTLLWLSLLVLIPLAALFLKTAELSFGQFIAVVSSARVLHAFELSFGLSLAAALGNLVFGSLVVWAIVRYRFPGRRLLDAIVDIPFALPTAVAGIALTTLYAESGLDAQGTADGAATLFARPFHMAILPASGDDNLKGKIRRVHGIGPARRIEIALGNAASETIIEVDALRAQQWRVGQVVGLRPQHYRLFPSRDGA